METENNFKIYNPLQQLEQVSPGGGSVPPPGSVTGGPGGSIANGTITNINIAPGTINGGPGGNIGTGTVTGGTGGNIAPGTVTGGPGGNIAANTITAGELAAGASAANINSGPAGDITGSKVSKADNTNFGVIEFDPSGDLTQTAAGSGIALLKAGAAAANINAGPAGAINSSQISGGPFLSSAPGSVAGGPGGNVAAGTVTGGSGGDLAAGTVTGGPGGNVAANAITAAELATGAAAANINSGPAGAINSSQIAGGPFVSAGTNAGNTQFGVVEFDPSGDLTETAPNSGIALLKTGAAAANINSGPAGAINSAQISGGPFLSAGTNAGNTQFGVVEFDPSGDLTETAPNSGIALLKAGAVTNSKINAGAVAGGPGGSIAPNTITNSELAAGAAASNINAGPAGSINASQISGGPFLSTAGGTMTGAITQSLAPVAGTDLANKSYVDSLAGPKAFSKWFMSAQQNVSAVIPAYVSLVFGSQETLPANATTSSANISIDGTNSILTITSTSSAAFKLTFHCETFANVSSPLLACNGVYRFLDTTSSAPVGTKGTTYFLGQSNLNTPLSSVTTPCTLEYFVPIAAGGTFSFSAQVGIVGTVTASVGEAPSTQAVEPYISVQQIY